MLRDLLQRLLLRALDLRLSNVESRVDRLERMVAADKEALNRLDAELDKLEDYVKSDAETDAAQVDERAARIRQLLVEAQGSGAVEPEEAAEREQRLADTADEAAEQTGTPEPEAPAAGTDAAEDDDAVSGREAGSVDPPEGQPEQRPRPEVQ